LFSISRRVAAEALGTALLVAAVVGSGIMGQALAGGNAALALLGNTVATGAMLAVLILVFGPISGAHFNPAVTGAYLIRREIEPRTAMLYVAAQVLGGLLGVAAAHAMFGEVLFQVGANARTGPGQWLAEGVATFGLVLTIFATSRFRPESLPYAAGLFISAGYWFTASTSFANPAVTIARGLTGSFSGIDPAHVPAFIAAQLAGAAAATFLFGWFVGRAPAVSKPQRAAVS
jgi:glycerol uptake facilitator-like aquaporin